MECELIITSQATIFDLLLGVGLIGLGLSIMAVMITIEICYFRNQKKGAKKHGKTIQQGARPDRKYGAYARRIRWDPLPRISGSCIERKHVQHASELQETLDVA